MDWISLLTGGGLTILGATVGAVVASKLRGRPPAPKSSWDSIDAKHDARVKKESELDTLEGPKP